VEPVEDTRVTVPRDVSFDKLIAIDSSVYEPSMRYFIKDYMDLSKIVF
jgi:hypothetical protein